MPTIRDIAKKCGVSYPTVSHVINKTRPVSQQTQKKVFAAIDEMGYIPNAVARGLSCKRMNTIGMVAPLPVVSLFDDNCHGRILEAALLTLPEYSQSAMLHFAEAVPEAREKISLYCDGRCDGLIVIGQPTDSPFVATLHARSFPMVCVTEAIENSGIPYFDVDQPGTTYTLAKHLLSLGHRKFAVLCGDSETVSVGQRIRGCRTAFHEFDIPLDDVTFLNGKYSDVSGYTRTRQLFQSTEKREQPTALLCFNDYIAHGSLVALAEMGIRCPEDVSVVGIDDAEAPKDSHPPITTMRLPLKDLGKGAVELLLDIINGKEITTFSNNIPATLVVKSSTCPPR